MDKYWYDDQDWINLKVSDTVIMVGSEATREEAYENEERGVIQSIDGSYATVLWENGDIESTCIDELYKV